MSFFEQNGTLSPDWELFLKNFPAIGAFKLYHNEDKSVIDENAARILDLDITADKEKIFSVIDKLTENPAEGYKNVFLFNTDEGQKWINLKFNYQPDCIFGFVQDVTAIMRKGIEKKNDTQQPAAAFPRESFIRSVRDALTQVSGSAAQCCMAVLHVNGVERVDSELNYDKTKFCIAAAARSMKKFESEDIIIGSKSYKEYYIFFRQLAKSEIFRLFKEIADELQSCRITDEYGNEIQTRTGIFSSTVGYCWYPAQATSLDMMMNYADFALYRAMSSGSVIREFDPAEFSTELMSYSASKELDELIDHNNFDYHFQPIVNAADGTIYAYEALMRPKNSTPLEVLKLARDNGRLYDIEMLTFENVLSIVNNNREKFENKKIFINSIPECMLKANDFNRLCEIYGDLMEHVVIEFTEQSDFTSDRVLELRDIYCSKGCEIAIDDYGSGYSNSAAMVKIGPDYLKIDRSLIQEINKNTRKQHFLSGIIDFARLNNIKVLAEGVETFEEMSVSIRRGVDLIQGFYTARPNHEILDSLSDDIIGEIEAVNRTKPEIKMAKAYEIDEKSYVPFDINKLSKEKYTDIIVSTDFVYLKGNGKDTANLSIRVCDNTVTTIVLEDVNINGGVRQCISLGDHADVRLDCRGSNLLSYDGICVPDNASLAIIGTGSLKIDSYRNNGCCIGSAYNETFGKIIIDSEGSLTLIANGDHSMGIGGGITDSDGGIELRRGEIKMSVTGEDCVAVGSYDGGCDLTLGTCTLDITVSGDRSVGVGSLNGAPTINLRNSDVKVDSSGVCTVGIGTIASFVRKSNLPKITIDGSQLELVFKGQQGAGIGSRVTECEISMNGTNAGIYFEGDKLAGIGCTSSTGVLSMDNCNINVSSLSGRDSIEIGFPETKSKVTNCKINNIPVNTEQFSGV
ncbi:MAG: EAL domain-containing protein [Eubacterium sp.]|nr:EAL domain-containing protein [Eubacterium sp.]